MFCNLYKVGILVLISGIFLVYINSEGVDSPCFDKDDCGLWHFECINDICQCDKDHIPDRNNKWCAVELFKPCGYHDTCFDPNADCYDVAIPKYGSCKCKPGFTFHEKKGVCSAVIGNNCTTVDDCIEGHCSLATACQTSNCTYNQCFCNNPLEPNINGSKCLPGLHKDCKNYGECAKEHAVCNLEKNECVCAETFKEAKVKDDVFCLAMLNNTCKNVTDCADIGAACLPKKETESENIFRTPYWPVYPPEEPTKYCVCGEGYVEHPTASECLRVATQQHDNCTENIQCTTFSGFGSECSYGKCRCKSDFYYDIDFDRCVRSCLCEEMNDELNQIKSVLKKLSPAFETVAKEHKLDLSDVLGKIKNFI